MHTNKIHIGSIIKQKVKQSLRRINFSRGAAYHIHENPSIGINLLRKISDISGYYFIENHHIYMNVINNNSDYMLIKYLNKIEMSYTLHANSVLLKITSKN
jgi:hypothetical protein